MNRLAPHVHHSIAKLVRQSAGQSVSIMRIVGELRNRFPHLPIGDEELTPIIAGEAMRAGRGVEFSRVD
jgi:hypothetical protein